MLKILLIFFILSFYNPAFSSVTQTIIYKMKLTNNLSFYFTQAINDNKESGSCVIKYPKKIFCEYDGHHKKIIVSNGESLVIQSKSVGSYYIYPLKRTSLEFLLDKDYLISKINTLEPRDIDGKYLNFTIFENNHVINLFFNKKTFNLSGWQTEDVYQNLIITFISSVRINEKIDNTIFVLPKDN